MRVQVLCHAETVQVPCHAETFLKDLGILITMMPKMIVVSQVVDIILLSETLR